MFTTFLAASKDEQYAAKLQDLRVPYWVCISQAMLVSAIALGFKLREWCSQIQSRVRTARDDGIEQAPTRHEALLAKIGEAKKTCIAHVIAVVVAVFEARHRRPIVLSTRLGLGLLPWPCAGHRCDSVQVNMSVWRRICRWVRSRSRSRCGGTTSQTQSCSRWSPAPSCLA